MVSVIFRRPSGQHFLVFAPSLLNAVAWLNNLNLPVEIEDFRFAEPVERTGKFAAPLEKLLDLGKDEERFVGGSPTLQIVIKRGFSALHEFKHGNHQLWPEHYVLVSQAHLGFYLRKDHTYRWAPGKCNGIYDHLGSGPYLHDICHAPKKFGFTPELVRPGAPFVFVLGDQDDFELFWSQGR
jgi:hypothetical protein